MATKMRRTAAEIIIEFCIMASLTAIASALNTLSLGAVSCASERSELERYLEDFFVSPDSPDSNNDSGKNYKSI